MLKTSFYLLFKTLLVLNVFANKMDPAYQNDEERNQPVESIPIEQAPWISGPGNQKYQFHIGKQSWLGAREKCLAQNADLVSIESFEEMQWLLSHYKPQFNHLRERQVQIGLLLDTIDGEVSSNSDSSSREWRWVNGKPLNLEITKWTMGEPFDHAKGKERCALLNINERRLDDVDCDLGASPGFNYRFVCQSSHEKHIEHESLNNPLWKKLEDILTFFGISDREEEKKSNNSLPIGAKEEGYWEKAFKGVDCNSETQQKEETNTNSKTNGLLEKLKMVTENSKKGVENVVENKSSVEKQLIKNTNEETNKNIVEQKLIEKQVEKVGEEKKVKVGGVAQHTTSKIIGGEEEQPPNEFEGARPTGGVVTIRRTETHISASSNIDNKKNNDNQNIKELKEEEKETDGKRKTLKSFGIKEVDIHDDSYDSKINQNSGLSTREKSQIINLNSRENIPSSINSKKPLIISNVPSISKDEQNSIQANTSYEKERDNEAKSAQITEKRFDDNEQSNIVEYTVGNKLIVNGRKEHEKPNEKKKNEENKENNEAKEDKIRSEKNNKEKEIKKTEDMRKENEDKVKDLRNEENTEEMEIKQIKSVKQIKVENEEKEDMKNLLPKAEIRDESSKLLVKEKEMDFERKKEEEKNKKGKNEENKNKINNEGNKVEEIIVEIKEVKNEANTEKNDEADIGTPNKINQKAVNEEIQEAKLDKSKEKEVKSEVKGEAKSDLKNEAKSEASKNETRREKINEAKNEIRNEAKVEAQDTIKMETTKLYKNEGKSEAKNEAESENNKEQITINKKIITNKEITNEKENNEAENKINKGKINKPTKQPVDPLSVVAETLERSLSSKEEIIEKKKQDDENIIKEKQKPVRDRIQNLEKLITAVQQMMGIGEGKREKEESQIEKTNKVLEEDEEKRDELKRKLEENEEGNKLKLMRKKEKELITETQTIAEVEEFSSPEFEKKSHSPSFISSSEESSEISNTVKNNKLHKNKNLDLTKNGKMSEKSHSVISDSIDEQKKSMAAMELDFEEAALQAKAHPGINSGDLVKNIILIENEEKGECINKEEGNCKNNKNKSKNNNRRFEPKNDGKWEIIKKISDENGTKNFSRIEKYGRKFGNKRNVEEEHEGKNKQGEIANLWNQITLEPKVVKQNNKDPSFLNSIHSETLESSPNGHILDQLIIFHPNSRKRSRENQIISQLLLPDGSFHGKLTEDWLISEIETEKSAIENITSSTSFSSSTPLSIFPAPDFSIINPDAQPPQQVVQRLEEERKRIDKVYNMFNREKNLYMN
ncbi:C-type lectin domain-containing protein [Meloidogyne graminicola]|uniref:C-type lectin domain-containing protein n=1 Tax=Meloidogyne graminicola TaxID=189291 RepID=A0A8T0A3R7_9BILA|nr:C-type lectin domain-containing protein [Meloidogyne graminicola]